ncbi:MAG: hypothetical protein ACREDV_10240 [Methylocella sp.]
MNPVTDEPHVDNRSVRKQTGINRRILVNQEMPKKLGSARHVAPCLRLHQRCVLKPAQIGVCALNLMPPIENPLGLVQF